MFELKTGMAEKQNMTYQLSDRIQQMEESKTIRMAQKGRELKSQGKEVINLSVGEPDFQTPDHIKEAAIQAIRDGYTHYPPVGGYPELKEAIVKKFQDDNGLTYQPNEVMVSNGAKHCLINALLALVNPGDEVITPLPYWVSYPEMIKIAGGKMVNIDSDASSDFKITPNQLEAAITEKTRVLIFNSPSNPAGAVYTKDEIRQIAEVLKKYPKVFIISDEIYEYINFQGGHYTLASFDDLKKRTAVINGVSKCFAMTGWRIGYMAADAALIKSCEKLQGQFTSGPNSISQRAALAALEGGNKSALEMRDIFRQRRDLVAQELQNIPGLNVSIPGGAFYFYPDIQSFLGKKFNGKPVNSPEEFCLTLLENTGLSLVPGDAFGDSQCVRISYAASEDQLQKGMKALKAFIEKME